MPTHDSVRNPSPLDVGSIKPMISGITVSVDIADKEYGNGQGSFMNIQAKYPLEGAPIEELEEVMQDGLDLYFSAWKTLLAGRFAIGKLGGTEFKKVLTNATIRVNKIRKYLKSEKGLVANDGQSE